MSGSFFHELKRRNVFKVATAYIVLAWVVIQVTDQAVPALLLPEWVNTFVFYLSLIAFPFILLFAWAYELTPEGIKREGQTEESDTSAINTGQKLNVAIISLLVVALLYFIIERRFLVDDIPKPTQESSQHKELSQSSTEPSKKEKSVSIEGTLTTIAVLPFSNFSSDPEQEFFSDGVSEEILNVLAQVPNLHVTSRSSSFAFKGKDINISEVAEKLGVDNILEGSVRKAGDRIRITAQLIEAKTDKHLWSSSYDRELTDVFTIQDEISRAIVDALKVQLNLSNPITVNTFEEVDLRAHQSFLKGSYYLEKENQKDFEIALAEFENAIDIEPSYAKAWMGKAASLIFLSEMNYGNIPGEIAFERAKAANDMALKLNPSLAMSHAIEGALYRDIDNDFEKSAQSYERAIELNPNNANFYIWYGSDLNLRQPENFKKLLELREKAYRLDPMSTSTLSNYAASLISYGKFDDALIILDQLNLINPDSPAYFSLKANIFALQYKRGEEVYHRKKAYEMNPSIATTVRYADGLSALGLIDEAKALLIGTPREFLKYYYDVNIEGFVNQIRLELPRAENDGFGYYFRGIAESMAGNCTEGLKFFDKSRCDQCTYRLYCYDELNDTDNLNALTSEWRNRISFQKDAGYDSSSYKKEHQFLLLIDDIEIFIQSIKHDISNNYVLGHDEKFNPIFSAAHEHSAWPELVKLSDINREKQRQKYLSLATAEEK